MKQNLIRVFVKHISIIEYFFFQLMKFIKPKLYALSTKKTPPVLDSLVSRASSYQILYHLPSGPDMPPQKSLKINP